MENRFRGMGYKELHAQIFDEDGQMVELSSREREQIKDELANLCWGIGMLWDLRDVRADLAQLFSDETDRDRPGFEFDTYYSAADNVPVVHIDTGHFNEDENGPICRVYLNDGELYENPVWPGATDAGHLFDLAVAEAGCVSDFETLHQMYVRVLGKLEPHQIRELFEQRYRKEN